MSVGAIRQDTDDIGSGFRILPCETGDSVNNEHQGSIYHSQVLGEKIATILSVVEAHVRGQYKRRCIFPVEEVLRRQREETRRISI